MSIPRASLRFHVYDDIIILVHGRDAPNDVDWNGFVEETGGQMMRRPRPVLVVSEGGYPSASQQKALSQELPPDGARTAVLVDARVAERVLIQSWFDGATCAFPKENKALLEALRYLGVDSSRDTALLDAIAAMLSAVTSGGPP